MLAVAEPGHDRPAGAKDAAGLAALAELTTEALRTEWRQLYRMPPPPRVRRELLLLGVAWKRQERAFGGLSAAMKRKLAVLADSGEAVRDAPRSRSVQIKPGARLIREWRGQVHSVFVREDGFEWQGRSWRSLSEIAREITGARWSGPRFFGLKAPAERRGANTDA